MKSANQMMFERPRAIVEEASASPLKSILFVVHEDPGLEARLQAALSLARSCAAHLHLLQVVPLEAVNVVDIYGGAFGGGEIIRMLEDHSVELRERLERQLRREDVQWTYERKTAPTHFELVKSSALADLFVIGRQPHWNEVSRTGPGLLGDLVCGTRTPMCIPGDGRETLDPFGPAVIAWNGSIESANAVRGTIGLLRMASSVRVVQFTEDKERDFPDTALPEYLSRHGIHTELEAAKPKKDVGESLVEFASRAGAEYIVMGAYSHSRAGEFLFGGVTRDLLHACPISLVMAQ